MKEQLQHSEVVKTVSAIYPSQEIKDEIDRYLRVTGLVRGREFVRAILERIAREKKAGVEDMDMLKAKTTIGMIIQY